MHIVSRAAWGARYPNGFGSRKAANLQRWLHHSVTLAPDLDFSDLNADSVDDDEAAAMRQIEAVGQSRFGGGFSYTFGVMPSGRVYEGHSIDRIGSHTGGRNSTSAGIVLVGNYDAAEPTTAQLQAVADLLRHGVEVGWWRSPSLTGGHRDLKSTACPGGHAYAQIPFINGLAAISGGGASAPTAPAAPRPDVARNADGSEQLKEDGELGPRTISRWQEVLGTPIDGVISKPSTLISVDQNYLNRVIEDVHVRNLTGKPVLDEDGWNGTKTIKVRQFLLYNHFAQEVLGRPARAQDFDGVDGKETIRLLQRALNRATAGSGSY